MEVEELIKERRGGGAEEMNEKYKPTRIRAFGMARVDMMT